MMRKASNQLQEPILIVIAFRHKINRKGSY